VIFRAAAIVKLRFFVVVTDALSVTITTNTEVPDAEGIPEIDPAVDKLKPEGKVPDARDQLYAGLPPAALKFWLYATPTDPLERGEAVVIARGGGATAIASARSAAWFGAALSVTEKVGLKVPATEGVPLRVPPAPNKRPGGRPLADQLYGVTPPLACRTVFGYEIPTVPFGTDAVLIDNGDTSTTRPISDVSANQIAPSGPAAIAEGCGLGMVGIEYSVTTPEVVILPILLVVHSVNQIAPSDPLVMPHKLKTALVVGTGNSVIAPEVEIRPILLSYGSVNQIAPSGPVAMPYPESEPNIVTTPAVVMRPMPYP